MARRMKLPRRDGVDDCNVGEGGVVRVGVVAPEETAESPEGVEGGGRGPEGESASVDHGRGRSGER